MKALDIKGLTYKYPDGTTALKDINLEISLYRRTVILGSNGSGKTTLLYHLNGIFLPQQGQVTVLGFPVNKENLKEIRRQVGLLFDNPDNQLFSTTVFNDIAFGPRNLKLGEDQVQSRVEEVLQVVGIEDLKDRPPYNLSLGQKKKAAIGGLLAMDPQLMVFDEPFSGLDPSSARQFMAILAALQEKGSTLIIVTHDVNMAYAWADQVIIMKEGEILAQGDVSLLRDGELMEKASLETPVLADVFRGTGLYPRTSEEASGLIRYRLKRAH